MRVLVTGAFGNIGSACLGELLRQGHAVRAFDIRSPRTEGTAREFRDHVDIFWGDIRDYDAVEDAVRDQEVVIHLAAIIPPVTEQQPDLARQVNVDGTKNVIRACEMQAHQPRLLFSSSLDLFGRTRHLPPPRRVTDPVAATDLYSEHKIECEKLVCASKLEWLIIRFADVPIIGMRDPIPMMFEIGLDNRIEALHRDDAALAVANALKTPEVWGKVILVGGGPQCQVTYREYYARMLNAMGIGMLPEEAFSKKDYCTDWLDTEESQRLLKYQRHTFDQIVNETANTLGWRRPFLPLVRPFVRNSILKLSPYWQAQKAKSQ